MIEKGRTDIGDSALSARSAVGLLRYGKIVEGDFRCPLSEMIERASEAGDLKELFCGLTDVLQIDPTPEENLMHDLAVTIKGETAKKVMQDFPEEMIRTQLGLTPRNLGKFMNLLRTDIKEKLRNSKIVKEDKDIDLKIARLILYSIAKIEEEEKI